MWGWGMPADMVVAIIKADHDAAKEEKIKEILKELAIKHPKEDLVLLKKRAQEIYKLTC